MPKFRSCYDKAAVYSVSGSAFEPVYSASYDDTGVLVLELTGKRDVFQEIQSHAESVDINNILLRYSRGDVDVLSRVKGFFADVSDLPKNYRDVLNSVEKAKEFFYSLPVEEKQKFNNSYTEFLVSLDDPEKFMDRFVEPVNDSSTDDVKEVVSDES